MAERVVMGIVSSEADKIKQMQSPRKRQPRRETGVVQLSLKLLNCLFRTFMSKTAYKTA